MGDGSDAAMADASESGAQQLVSPAEPVSEGGGGVATLEGTLAVLLHDCMEAIKWCQAKDKQFHRATYR